MNYENWKIIVGEEEIREWNDRQYRFRVSRNQQDEIKIIDALQSKTPIRHFLESALEDEMIRALSFLSYYQINPTFKHKGDGIGADFFWFPLDKLNEDRYELLSSRLKDREEVVEEEDEDDEPPLPDFPVMSTVSGPVIEAATSDAYVKATSRESKEGRRQVLQSQIKEKKREMAEEAEEWLNEGLAGDKYPEDLSTLAAFLGRLPSLMLLEFLEEEESRVKKIYEIIDNLDVPSEADFDSGPKFLLDKLNKLAEDHPVFVNPAIEAFCLDENNRDCEYHVTKNRGLRIDESLKQCEYCGSDTFRMYRTGLDGRVQEAWMMGLLPELVVARVLEECDWTEEVIPHRMVQMKDEDGGMTSSAEVDVSVHTVDDKVLFFEITSQTSALDRLHRKQRKFEKKGIEYDGIVQVSPIDRESMLQFDDKVVAASGWMIKTMENEEFKDDIYANLSSVAQ